VTTNFVGKNFDRTIFWGKLEIVRTNVVGTNVAGTNVVATNVIVKMM
jgi:hypothetical protein